MNILLCAAILVVMGLLMLVHKRLHKTQEDLRDSLEYRVGMARLWYIRIEDARDAGRKEAIENIELRYQENPAAGYQVAIASCKLGFEPTKENK